MAPAVDDSMSARISSNCPQDTRDVLHHAWGHDLSGLRNLIKVRGMASAQDPVTGETPLHAAIRACGLANPDPDDAEEDGCVEEAADVLRELFLSGAIWNDVDGNNETPGCVAHRLGRKSLYDMCVDAGVRAELLFALMSGYEELSSGSDEPDHVAHGDRGDGQDEALGEEGAAVNENQQDAGQARFMPPGANEKSVTSADYLQSTLTYDSSKVVDSDLNGVMMSWETDIMRRSVSALLPGLESGKRILNIGFGMGIVDGVFAETEPSRHHIVEAHPSVLKHLSEPHSRFGRAWEQSGPGPDAYKLWAGRWQEIVPKLLEKGEIYDAIYFDTFAEDYAELKMFFTEYVPGLLDQEGTFSFFNGLGADRQVCYDVYTKVVDMHCADAGLDVEWRECDVDMAALAEDGQGEWEGVRRRYWTLKSKQVLLMCPQ
ncbi:hypothetical protein UVI_02035500 [Ustilaginoidea virens]|uniref:Arginine N-methyltransferase 2 n=1 Tax=Ustilaginoidea virens TaxID=1159556 RepID=A0A063BXF1_USTVR|nr:hypothetical protein UVI_02035500 [Ustilaginoidea virens]